MYLLIQCKKPAVYLTDEAEVHYPFTRCFLAVIDF